MQKTGSSGNIGQWAADAAIDPLQKDNLSSASFDMFPRFETMWTYYNGFTSIPTSAADIALIERNNIKGAYYTTN
jgi:hypothetical protein